MPYTRQLYVAFLLAALSLVLFYMSSYFTPDISPRSEPGGVQVAAVAFVMIGLVLSAVLTLAFGISALMWRLNGGEPEPGAAPLGKRLKGAGLMFSVAMLGFALFVIFA